MCVCMYVCIYIYIYLYIYIHTYICVHTADSIGRRRGEVLLRGVGTLRYFLILSENSACQVPICALLPLLTETNTATFTTLGAATQAVSRGCLLVEGPMLRRAALLRADHGRMLAAPPGQRGRAKNPRGEAPKGRRHPAKGAT